MIGICSLYFFFNISSVIVTSLKRSFYEEDVFDANGRNVLKTSLTSMMKTTAKATSKTSIPRTPMTPLTPLFNVKQSLIPPPQTPRSTFLPDWANYLKPSLAVADIADSSLRRSPFNSNTRKPAITKKSPSTTAAPTIEKSTNEKRWHNMLSIHKRQQSQPTKTITASETMNFLNIDNPSPIEDVRRWFYGRIFLPLLEDILFVEKEFTNHGLEHLLPSCTPSTTMSSMRGKTSPSGLSPMINMISSTPPAAPSSTTAIQTSATKPQTYSELLLRAKGSISGVGITPLEVAYGKRVMLEYYLARPNETPESRKALVARIKEVALGGPLLSTLLSEGKDDSFIITLFCLYMDKNLASTNSCGKAYSGVYFAVVDDYHQQHYHNGIFNNNQSNSSVIIESNKNVLSVSSQGRFSAGDMSFNGHLRWELPFSTSNLPFYAVLVQVRLVFMLNYGYLGIGNLSSGVIGLNAVNKK